MPRAMFHRLWHCNSTPNDPVYGRWNPFGLKIQGEQQKSSVEQNAAPKLVKRLNMEEKERERDKDRERVREKQRKIEVTKDKQRQRC